MEAKIYQVQVALKEFKPKIWRKLLVPSDLLLRDFHKIIQTSMGWTNSHLHQFVKDEVFYTEKMEDDDMWNEMNNVDYKTMKISDLLKKEKDEIVYEYDFGDGWEHDIILEKILPVDDKIKYPVCLSGKMNCPPEDSGGVWGYAEMLKILKQPYHKEYESTLEWLGDEFDPEHFDKDEVNESLEEKDYGCIEL
jgi:hypothetical protein